METSKKDGAQIEAKEWQEEAVLDHLNCCLCGTELQFQHKVDHIHLIVTEDARCTNCGVKHRTHHYGLQ